MRDVDENPVTVLLATFLIYRQEGAVDDRPGFSVAPSELKFDIAHRAVAFELCHLPRPNFRSHEVAGAISLQIIQRLDSEHLEKRGICIDDLPVQGRDVNSLFQ